MAGTEQKVRMNVSRKDQTVRMTPCISEARTTENTAAGIQTRLSNFSLESC
jgi:hypothetical protein